MSKTANTRLKNAATTRAGFDYQDYIAGLVLIDFYQNPDLYEWVQFECEKDGTKGLDDIVAYSKKDNKYNLYQVKFTTDPNRDDLALSFEWLTKLSSPKKSKSKTTLLQKWSRPVLSHFTSQQLGDAALKTNRKPDKAFQTCIKEGYLQKAKIPHDIWKDFVTQLGSENNANIFISNFRFEHSLSADEEALRKKLRDRVIPDYTDELGWYEFERAIKEWASYKKRPAPDGKINYQHIAQLLSKVRGKSLPQDFSIPEGYKPPDKNFHASLLEKVKNSQVAVITGAPGRGKSTYLSYLVESLRKKEMPVIRHHYFLSLDDNSDDRVSYFKVITSLEYQIEKTLNIKLPNQSMGDKVESGFSANLRYAATQLKKGQRLIVVIDGLDHVWRERGNIEQMNHLFNCLLPLPDNVTLLVGTQNVPNNQLPIKLVNTINKKDWNELPPMNLEAIRSWLGIQYKAKIFRVRWPKNANRELNDISAAFFQISGGHPLHLIYSFEAAIKKNVEINDDDIKLLPACPNGKIERYYDLLWMKLTNEAKEIMYLMAAAEFSWPENGLINCLGNATKYSAAYNQVGHLLDRKISGTTPFHGSVLVYINKLPEYAALKQSFQKKILKWLQKKAPNYYRWSWLWLIEAELGNADHLIHETSREWVVRSLAAGFPIHQMIKILDKTEMKCFEEGLYPRLIDARSIKTKLYNGPEFQTYRYDSFNQLALFNSDDKTHLNWMSDNLPHIEDDELVTVARFFFDKNAEIPAGCLDEMNRRISYAFQFEERPHYEGDKQGQKLVRLAALARVDTRRVARYLDGQGNAQQEILKVYLDELMASSQYESIFNFYNDNPNLSTKYRALLDRIIVHIVSGENIAYDKRKEFLELAAYPMTRSWAALNKKKLDGDVGVYAPDLTLHDESTTGISETHFHSHFFYTISTILKAKGEYSIVPRHIPEKLPKNIIRYFEALDDAAIYVADLFTSEKPQFSFDEIFDLVDDVTSNDYSLGYDASMVTGRFRNAVNKISIDLYFLFKGAQIAPDKLEFDLTNIATKRWWHRDLWLDHYLESRMLFLSDITAQQFFGDYLKFFNENVTNFNERTDTYIKLAEMSHRQVSNEKLEYFLQKAASCIMGYLYHKDVTIFQVLEAIEVCGDFKFGNIPRWLNDLEKIIFYISEYTDGDETRHSKIEFMQLLRKHDRPRLIELYKQYVLAEEWYYSEHALEEILKFVDLKSEDSKALIRTITSAIPLAAIKDRAENGDKDAVEVLKQIKISPEKRDRKHSKQDGDEPVTRNLKYSNYPPKKLSSFVQAVRKISYSAQSSEILNWINYWRGKSKGIELLAAIEKLFDEGSRGTYEFERHLDELFSLSLALEGKKKAYKWLVRAHRYNRGWDRYFSGEEKGRQRCRVAAKHYKNNWKQFIVDTSYSMYGTDRGIVVGQSELVYFLALVDQTKLATDITQMLVLKAKDELADQPIYGAK